MSQELLALFKQKQAEAEAAKAEREQRLSSMLVERAKAPVGVDLSPLAGLADSMAGTKVASGVAQQAANARGYQKTTDDLFDQLNTLKGSVASANLPANLLGDRNKQDAIGQRFMTAQANSAYKDWMGKNQKELKGIQEFDKRGSNLEDALASGNIERINGALATYARLVNEEKGVLTDADVGRTMIPTIETWTAKIKSAMGDKTTGQVSPEVVSQLVNGLSQARKENQAAALEAIQSLEDTYLSPALGISGNAGYNLKPAQTAREAAGRLGQSRYADKLEKTQGAVAGQPQAPASGAPGLGGIDWKAKAAAMKGKK
jgi:hypothetical protein